MNILVIGNGFDIAHGLPTKYGDFLEFIKNYIQYKSDNLYFENIEDYKEIVRLKNEQPELFNEIDNLINENVWYRHFESVYESRKIEGKEGWVDFEREISNIIQIFDGVRCSAIKQTEQGSGVAFLSDWQIQQLKVIIWGNVHLAYSEVGFDLNYIQFLKKQLLQDLNRITRCLEIYLAHCISIKDNSKHSMISKLDIDCVLSFNYTETYRLLYDDGTKTIQYHYIHGVAKKESNIETCNMILGIDEYLNDSSKDTDNAFVQFKKFYQRIFKGTGNEYTEWVIHHENIVNALNRSPNPPIMNVYIFGHSLDKTDGDILKQLILSSHTKTTIFYHNREALADQISNLVSVVGEDELIKRTNKATQTIFFELIGDN